MASPSSLLTRVTAAMEKIAPLKLADHKWDNVGLLVEAPFSPCSHCLRESSDTSVQAKKSVGTVLLTNDLTRDVLEESIRKGVGVVIAYHPPIFTPLKRLRLSEEKHYIILRAIAAGISIYSPHTALDAAECGVNDWLASLVDDQAHVAPIQPVALYNEISDTANCSNRRDGGDPAVGATRIESVNANNHNDDTRRDSALVCAPVTGCIKTGYGRILHLHTPVTLCALVERVKNGLQLLALRVATPSGWNNNTGQMISTLALCAGSGGSVFRQLQQHVDVLLTGEMGHHEVLAATAKGQIVILCEHSNTERGYLRDVLYERLKRDLGDDVSVIVSECDADPLTIW